jgi:cytochrome oxidase Cu insertion factor (SCO1/SenC/PrrC family)
VAHEPEASPARPVPRLIWAAALLLAVAVGIVAFLLARSTSEAAPLSKSPLADAPGATWPAGTRPAPDFRLTDQDGKPVSISGFRGRPVIVTFIDPLCRTYCPLEGRRLNGVVRSYPPATRPAIVAVSVNVQGNARTNLTQVVRRWRLVPEWRFAVGDEKQLESVWKRYHVGVLVTTKHVAGVTVRDVAHTEAAYVIDADGYERALFLWPYTADSVARTLRGLTTASTS